ncbi:MAG: glutamate dehydrogenase [Frankiales bacterium]|nr:glutamate dehydrogenase [Frankiales bacterium]
MSSGSSVEDQSVALGDREGFLGDYYQHLAEEDARSYSHDLLASRAETHRHVAAHRRPGHANVDIANEEDSSVVYVVTDDMPFLVDSVNAELVRQKAAIRLVLHPLFVVTRNRETGELVKVDRVPSHIGLSSGDTAAMPLMSHLIAQGENTSHMESWIAVEINRVSDEARASLLAGLDRVLADVRAAVEDWPKMRNKAMQIAASLDQVANPAQIAELRQAKDLLRWLDDGNFTFLGYREYDLVNVDGEDLLELREDSGLGLLREKAGAPHLQHLTDAGRKKAREKRALVITKANSRSTVHRPAYLDYIGVKSFDAAGNVNGERRFIGLFATSAYAGSVRDIPIVREKVEAVLGSAGFPPDSHSGKDLLGILETYPRDELFQIEVEDLAATAAGIQRLQERRRTRLFLRPDIYGRFMSAVIYLPRDRYTTNVRLRIEEELRSTFKAESIDYEARMTESALARLFYRIRLPKDADVSHVNAEELERRLVRAARSWSEGVAEVLRSGAAGQQSKELAGIWSEAFPAGYRVDYEVEDALEDIARFEKYGAEAERVTGARQERPGVHVYLPKGAGEDLEEDARVKLYMLEPKSLSQILPYFHNLGLEVLDERPFEIETADGRDFFLYDLGLKYPAGVDPIATGELLADSFGAAVSGAVESDSLDRLVLREGIHWRQITVLRSYTRYLRQMGNTNSTGFVADTLLANPDVTRALTELFASRFDPALAGDERPAAQAKVRVQLAAAIEEVATLDADRVLRTFANLIEATLRTNYYQYKPHLSFKLDPAKIDGLPFPRPMFEIWVYSPRVEGVHLRFGKVARGGLRWSDRREDFRTEILGLVRAQTVKNAVIVPTGAKGGFFAKRLPDPTADRAAWLAEGVESYKTFIRGLLDLTDNLVAEGGKETVVPPSDVVRHDDDDSYLVVAADKGTATFSDIANGLAAEYGFWLGDAFASGGSAGYDHKAMGITARGAWESVQRHFRELGVDTQTQEVTVVGIGDMSGDVFGNGMLLSRSLRLVAAFDHRHVFLDPDPDPETSYAERARLFALPRSSWADYDSALLSPGGGVYPRTAKSVPVSPQVRARLGLPDTVAALPPMQLLTAVLLAPVDLLWNGAIGTYVKSAAESHGDVGDKANDAVRVDGAQLRCRVVGEGGNLGFTQLGRIEAARAGVKLNTDAIDNSAGVDCSDHEVNIKILLDRVVRDGALTPQGRDALLAEMTDDVARLVLRDNYAQNVLLGNARASAPALVGVHRRYLRELEVAGVLNREIEFLPSGRELEARASAGTGLTSPELSVLAAYAKNSLKPQVLESSIPDEPWFQGELRRYFPPQLTERYGDRLADHPLRRQIVTTGIVNDLVNRAGITFAFRARDETGAGTDEIVRAYVLAREVFGLGDYWNAIEQLDGQVGTDVQVTLHVEGRRLVDRVTRWFLRARRASLDVDAELARFGPVVAGLLPSVPRLVQSDERAFLRGVEQALLDRGVPGPLAERSAALLHSFPLLHVVELAAALERPPAEVAELHFALAAEFGVDAWLGRVSALPRADRWQSLARSALREDLYAGVAGLTSDVLTTTEPGPPAQRLAAWREHHGPALVQAGALLTEVARGEACDLAALSVAVRAFRTVLRA